MAQITGAPAPNNESDRTLSRPELVRHEPRPPKRGWWVVLLGVIVLGGIALHWKTRPSEPRASGPAQAVVIRTVNVTSGAVERTIRLTGTTAARNFASLVAPQMRGRGGMRQVSAGQTVQAGGGRGGGGGGGTAGGGGGGGDRSSSGGSSSDSGSTTTGTTASTASSGSGAQASAGIGVSGTSGAIGANSNLVSSVTRFSGSSSRTSSTARTSISGSSSSSSAMGSSGLGSTASSLQGGGGGGGMGDYQLVLEKLVPGGSRVRKGDVIAEFDRQYMLQRLDDFRANHNQNEAALRSLQSNLDVQKKAHQQLIEAAKATLDKAQLDLKTTPVRSKIVAEQLKLAVEEAQANHKLLLSEVRFKDISFTSQMRRAKLDLDQEALDLRRSEANADKMLLKAPMDGICVMTTIFRGGEFAQIQAGDQVFPGMTIMQVVDQSSMVINATVSQADIESIRVGAKAQVHFDAYPDLVLPATLYSIGAIARSNGFRPNYVAQVPVVLKLDRIDPRVIPDLSVSADIVISSEGSGTVAPLAGIHSDPATNKPVAFVKAGAGWEKRDIELGLSNNVQAIVRSGLRPGEVIAAEWPVAEKPVEKNKA